MSLILIVDDKKDIRLLVADILEDDSHTSVQASNSTETLAALEHNNFDAVILDIWLEDSKMDGIELLKVIRKSHPLLPIIMISGHANPETAALAIKLGAYDFIEKPFNAEKLLLLIKRAIETKLLAENNIFLQQNSIAQNLVGVSPSMNAIREKIRSISNTNSRVLISGENGSGKSLIAKLIHYASNRQKYKFVQVKCCGKSDQEIQQILFGDKQKKITGAFLQGQHGTLLLDEITSIPLDIQKQLVEILQSNQLTYNGHDYGEIDVRIIATTTQNPKESIEKGVLDQTLYSRISINHIHTPPLSERRQDLTHLIEYFCQFFQPEFNNISLNLTPEVISSLLTYQWPGNIKQLRNTIERFFILAETNNNHTITIEDLNKEIITYNATLYPADYSKWFMHKNYKDAKNIFETEYLQVQIKKFAGNISKTASFIGLDRTALHRKLRTLQISNEDNDEK